MIVSRIGLRRMTLAGLVSMLALAGALALGAGSAFAARGHIFDSAFGHEGEGNGQFKSPEGVAVNDATGRVYVVDKGNNRVEYFSAAGTYEGQFNGEATPAEAFSGPQWIAVDNACHIQKLSGSACSSADPSNEDVYVADAGHNVIDKFSATGTYLGQLKEGSPGVALTQISGLAVDSSGELWVAYKGGEFFAQTISNYNDAQTNSLIETRDLVGSGGGGVLEPGFGIDSQHNLYVALGGYGDYASVMSFNSNGEPLQTIEEVPSRGQVSAITAELASGNVYIDKHTSIQERTFSGALIENIGEGHLEGGTGIGVNASSETVYVADGKADEVDVFLPEPPAKPTVESESISDVTADRATLNGSVKPRGPSSEYRFEYGACSSRAVSSCAGSPYPERVPVPDASIGSGWTVVKVSQHVQDLQPATTYHFRVSAVNEHGEVNGPEQNFTTQAVGGELALPDQRQWELVSPPNMHGAVMLPISEGLLQASSDGNAFADAASEPTEAQALGNGNVVYVYSGRGPDGWASRDISPGHTYSPGVGVGRGNEFRFFSEDLSQAIVQPFGGFTPLSPEASEQTAYLRSDYLGGVPASICEESCYQPLVDAGNVPAGTHFGEVENEECHLLVCGPHFLGATPDAKHIVLRSPFQLTETPTEGHSELYEWSAGRLTLVSVLPKGETNGAGGSVATYPTLGQRDEAARNAISTDGTRVIFESRQHLYLRDTASGETLRLDLPEGGTGQGNAEPMYMTASSDDSRVFFIDEAHLTAESSPSGSDLYEYDINAPAGSRLKDLSVDTNEKQAANVIDVTGSSENGSYVYFTAAGALAEGASAGACTNKTGVLEGYSGNLDKAFCNLYVSHEGKTTLIAALSPVDYPDWGGTETNLSNLVGRVSPNGRYLAFMSQRQLTSYNNTDAITGTPDEEVYLYDASNGKLSCASCDPTGARPIGQEYRPGGGEPLLQVGADRVWNGETTLAALIPPWTRLETNQARYQSRYLSNNGRLFFDGYDPLVPQDVGGSWGVYEYEPAGVGSCSTTASGYSERVDGCQALISSGTSSEESAFLDASAGGGDVFFLTSQKLVSGDYNSTPHVYDAHECTASAPCYPEPVATPPPCESGEGCKAAPNVQPAVFGAPASATFNGKGDLTTKRHGHKAKHLTRKQKLRRALARCKHHHNKRERRLCARRARKRYRAEHARTQKKRHHGRRRHHGARHHGHRRAGR